MEYYTKKSLTQAKLDNEANTRQFFLLELSKKDYTRLQKMLTTYHDIDQLNGGKLTFLRVMGYLTYMYFFHSKILSVFFVVFGEKMIIVEQEETNELVKMKVCKLKSNKKVK